MWWVNLGCNQFVPFHKCKKTVPIFTKLNVRQGPASLACLCCLQDIQLSVVQVIKTRNFFSICLGDTLVQTGPNIEKQGLYKFTSSTCTKFDLETFCSLSSLGEKAVTTHRYHHEELTALNSILVSLSHLKLPNNPWAPLYLNSSCFFSHRTPSKTIPMNTAQTHVQ